jgi:hypothetical protein
MADLRLILSIGALGALAATITACAPADAQPPAIEPPPGWTPQPAIAAAAKAAAGKQTVDGVEAFGEPAMGCYMLWMSLRGTGSAKDVAEQLIASLAKPASTDPKAAKPQRTLAIDDVVKPTADTGVLSLAFTSPPYEGRMRVRLGGGKLVTLACFANQREPLACATACTAVLAREGMP